MDAGILRRADPEAVGLTLWAHAHGLIGQLHMQGVAVHRAVDGHGGDAEFAAAAQDAQGDFAAVGDQDLANQLIFREVMAMGCSLRRIPVPSLI